MLHFILHDPRFWVAVAFFAFIIALYKPVSKAILNMLDSRRNNVRKSLDEALKLKKEAQELLNNYQQKQRQAEEEAKKIIKDAETEALAVSANAAKEIEEAINRRMDLALQRISSYEANIIKEIRNNAIDVTMSTVRLILIENLSKETAQKLISKSLEDVSNKLN